MNLRGTVRLPSPPVVCRERRSNCTSQPESNVIAQSARKLRLVPLIAATYFMVSGGPYGLEDIIGKAGYWRGLLMLAVLPFFWSLPTSLMVGELASAIPAEGGYYVWVRRALGRFWGFQDAWLSLAASVFDMAIYPTIFVLYLGRVAPAWTAGYRGTAWALAVIVGCTLWNLRGASSVGEGSVWLFVVLLTPFVVLVAAGLWRWHGHGTGTLMAPVSGTDLPGAISVALWNYMGWDNASTVAQEVDQPQRNYPRAMIGAAALVALTYILPLLAMGLAGLGSEQFSTGAWTDAARFLVGPWLGLAVVLGGMINGAGMFNPLMMSYARVPFAMAQDGLLPKALTRENARGVPYVALVACGALWALALRFSFERLISIDLVLYGASLLLEFVALAVLRRKEPHLDRPFRIPGGFAGTVLAGVGPLLLIGYASWAARGERVGPLPALVFAALVGIGGVLVYAVYATVQKAKGSSMRTAG
ncbi:MAG: APC family permease [Janthinobacterium lividum]